jgi:hypothetical protein
MSFACAGLHSWSNFRDTYLTVYIAVINSGTKCYLQQKNDKFQNFISLTQFKSKYKNIYSMMHEQTCSEYFWPFRQVLIANTIIMKHYKLQTFLTFQTSFSKYRNYPAFWLKWQILLVNFFCVQVQTQWTLNSLGKQAFVSPVFYNKQDKKSLSC